MNKMYLIIGMLIIIIMIIITWVAYAISVTYQQTLTLTIPFEDTYRYVPNLNKNEKYKLDTIKVKVTGALKKDVHANSTITPSAKIRNAVYETIIEHYRNSLILHEAQTFVVTDDIVTLDQNRTCVVKEMCELKRFPIAKIPTAENLSIIFFNKLAPVLKKLGAQIVSVKISSNGIHFAHSRHKISKITN